MSQADLASCVVSVSARIIRSAEVGMGPLVQRDLLDSPVNMRGLTQAVIEKDHGMRKNFGSGTLQVIRSARYGLLAVLVGAAVVACGGGDGGGSTPTGGQAPATTPAHSSGPVEVSAGALRLKPALILASAAKMRR